MKDQVLDAMDLEREKGITIKSHPIAMDYLARDGQTYQLNLIDTPGHVDFTYEVSRSLAACEGAILLVDASQGVEAQTLSNFYLAVENGLTIVPVLNKIDLPAARPDEVGLELAHLIDVDPEDILRVSAKAGIGVQDLLEHVIAHVPPPKAATPGTPLQALIFDSHFDTYRGVVVYVRVVEGHVKAGDMIQFASNRKKFEVGEVGVFQLRRVATDRLEAGQVGYIVAGVHDVHDAHVGDTVSERQRGRPRPLPGYREVKPMVFSGLYPIDAVQYEDLKDALAKLKLNDASLVYEPETSIALGFGFRCGFLGLLHMEIVQERLRREYDVDLIATVPSVEYKVLLTNGDVVTVDNPTALPPPTNIELIEEPYVRAHVLVPTEYVGNIMKLCQEKRGVYIKMDYIEDRRARLEYHLPLSEIVIDFYDRLKSISRGYASLDYEYDGATSRPSWSSWTSCSTAIRWTRCPASCTGTRRTSGGGT